MTYSLDFRKKVLAIKEKEGLSFAAVSQRFAVGLASVVRWSNNIAPKERRERPAIKINMEALQEDVLIYPDAYQHERAKRLGVSKNCIWHALRRLKVTYKKNPHASQGRGRKTLCFLPNPPTLSR